MSRTLPLALALALAAAPVFAAPSGAPSGAPKVRGAWARPTLGAAGSSAVYLEVVGGGRDDTLLGASTPAAGALELHRSEMKDGMMSMAPAGRVPVGKGALVRLAPGGLHLMLMGARKPLRVGDRIPVTLRFARAGAVKVDVPVRASPTAR